MAYRRTAAVEAKQQRTRALLVRAARHRIAADGLRGVSVAAVARDAGVSVGTVYRYFDDKPALLGEVIDSVCRSEIDVVAKVAVEPDGHADRLLAAVETFARRAVASGRVAYAVIAEPAPAEIEQTRVAHRRALADVFAGLIAEGVDAGAFPPQSPAIVATAIVGAVSEVIVGPLSPTANATDRTTDRTIDCTAEVDDVLAELTAHIRRAVIGTDQTGGT